MKVVLEENHGKNDRANFIPLHKSFDIQNVSQSKSSGSHMRRLERGYKATSDDYSSDVASAYDAYTMKLSQALREPKKGLHAGLKKESQTKELADKINKQVQ